jgi:tetratricopeptide (TPR) repeat protein
MTSAAPNNTPVCFSFLGSTWGHILLIIMAGAAVYANSLHAPFVLDDTATLELISKKGVLETIFHGGSRRVADVTFILNYSIHGFRLPGYHLINLAVHLAGAITLFYILNSAIIALRISFPTNERFSESHFYLDRFVPLAAALLFVSHPLQTQAVTYIIQRYTSLASFLYLLSVLMFIKARIAYENKEKQTHLLLFSGLSLVATLLAFGSKQSAFSLPLMLIAFEVFLFRGRMFNRRFFLACGALLVISSAALLLVWRDRSFVDFLDWIQLATSETDLITRNTYFLTQIRVVVTYLRLLFLPFGQSLIWDSPLYTSFFSLPVATSAALHSILFFTAILLFRRSQKNLLTGRLQTGALQRISSLGIVWFYTAMSVESSVIPIMAVMFEHRIYLPSAGFFMTIAACAALVAQINKLREKVAWILLAVVCLGTGSITIARNQEWRSPLKLSQDAYNKFPNNYLAMINLCYEYLQRDMPGKALPLIVSTTVNFPQLVPYAKIYLGKTLQGLHIDESRFSTGEEYIRPEGGKEIIDMDDATWRKWESIICNNLALAYEYMGEQANAFKMYEASLEMNPSYDKAWYNLGLLNLKTGNRKNAEDVLARLKGLNQALADSLAAAMQKQTFAHE